MLRIFIGLIIIMTNLFFLELSANYPHKFFIVKSKLGKFCSLLSVHLPYELVFPLNSPFYWSYLILFLWSQFHLYTFVLLSWRRVARLSNFSWDQLGLAENSCANIVDYSAFTRLIGRLWLDRGLQIGGSERTLVSLVTFFSCIVICLLCYSSSPQFFDL